MHPQCEFNTKNEGKIIELLKDSPKQYCVILEDFHDQKSTVNKLLKKRTVNRLLKKMCADWKIFRVEVDGKVFYKLNLFHASVFGLFAQVTYAQKFNPQWVPLLTEIKNDVLINCPNVPYERIIRRWRIHLGVVKPQAAEVIKALEFCERMSSEKYMPTKSLRAP